MKRATLCFVALLCSVAIARDIELDARTAKPLPTRLVAAVRSDIGNGCDLPKDDVGFSKTFRTGNFNGGRRHGVIVVQASSNCLCSPTGNCDFWVFERSKNGYRLLLHAAVVQTFKFLPKTSHGYRDLQTSTHGSAFDSDLMVYRFNGEQYEVEKCLSRSYNDGHGNFLKKPILKEGPCH